MKKYIHAGYVGFIINFISIFVVSFSFVVPMASAMMMWTGPTCCSSVAFIPGLEASRLYAPGFVLEDKLWEPNTNGDAKDLFMDSNGKSVRSDVYTRDVVDKVTIGKSGLLTAGDIYGNFARFMNGLVENEKITAWEALPYDWRLDLGDVVNGGTFDVNGNLSYLSSTSSSTPSSTSPDMSFMISQIQALANNSITGQVTIITHSNGGLVAKVLIQKLQDLKTQGQSNLIDRIDRVIMVAAPQLGSADAVASLLHGYKLNYGFGFILAPTYGRAMGSNMPGAYNLLPSKAYFDAINEPIITFATSTDTLNNYSKTYGNDIADNTSLDDFLLGADGRASPAFDDIATPAVLNSGLLARANSTHSNLDVWQFPTSIEVDQVAGWGIDTLYGFEYGTQKSCTLGIFSCKNILDTKPMFSSEGDGTVLYPSALSSVGQKYFVDIAEYNKQMTAAGFPAHGSHENIMGAGPTELLISNILNESKTLPEFVTTEKPLTSSKRLLVTAHSPISLDAYDASGRHTGLLNNPDSNSDIQLVEQNIPNSFYSSFGEGKYLGVDADSLTSITFQGTDYGSFTLDTTVSQSGAIIAASTFTDIPVTPSLKGSIVNSTSSSPVLSLDVDGDGTVDIVATSTPTFDPILYLEIMKKTVNSFDLKKPAEKLLVQKLDQLENLIKKGKLKNADKDVQKFIKNVNRNPNQKRLRKITDDERNQLVQMLSNLVDNLI